MTVRKLSIGLQEEVAAAASHAADRQVLVFLLGSTLLLLALWC
jgi:hypothetical protein